MLGNNAKPASQEKSESSKKNKKPSGTKRERVKEQLLRRYRAQADQGIRSSDSVRFHSEKAQKNKKSHYTFSGESRFGQPNRSDGEHYNEENNT